MSVRILVVYHKQAPLVDNDVFLPIGVGIGAGNLHSEFLAQNMLCDNSGDNISSKNAIYNELTAIYWAWKNYEKIGSPDYIGLNHYRRYFVFDPKGKPYYEVKALGSDFLDRIKYSEQSLKDLLRMGDFVAPIPSKRHSVRDNYKLAHNIEELNVVEKIIRDRHPSYAQATSAYLGGSKVYFHNMYIFDRALFFRYCQWIFDILTEYEKIAPQPIGRMYVSERLTGIFFTKLEEEGKKPILLPTLFVADKRVGLKQAIQQTKANIKSGNSSLLYALKPLIMFFMPSIIIKARRQKQ